MKKIISVFLAAAMLICMSACSLTSKSENSTSGDKATQAAESEGQFKAADMSKYPAELSDWTPENMNEYFTEIGVYTNKDYVYIQDEATYYSDMAVRNATGYMDDDGNYYLSIFYLDPSKSGADALIEQCKKDHAITLGDDYTIDIDHMVGDYAFSYQLSIDDEFVKTMDAAVEQFAKDTGAEMVF